MPALKIFDAKLPLCLLCTIINTSPDDVILPKNWHIGEMKLLSNHGYSLNPPAVNKVTHDINSNYIDAQGMQPESYSFPLCKIHSNSQPMPKTSVLMANNVQIHRQVPLNNAKISKETKTTLYKQFRNMTP